MQLHEHIKALTALQEYAVYSGNGADLMDFVNSERLKLPALFVSNKGGVANAHSEDGRVLKFTTSFSLYCKVRGNGADDLATVISAINANNAYPDSGETNIIRILSYTWLFEDQQRDIFEINLEVF